MTIMRSGSRHDAKQGIGVRNPSGVSPGDAWVALGLTEYVADVYYPKTHYLMNVTGLCFMIARRS